MHADDISAIHAAIETVDPQLSDLIVRERLRQSETLTLIASENYASVAVMSAVGSVLGNKYSEGYPGRRYYEGQQILDLVEQLAIDRAISLFGVEHANVQAYSGSPANLAILLAFVQPGDTIMGMSLPMGGHLTHGWRVAVSGKWFNSVPYPVQAETGRVDLDEVRSLALQARPKLMFCGGTAIPRTIDFPGFAEIAQEVGALLIADVAHIAGLIAGGAHPSPVGHADVISTTTHKTLRGPRGALLMADSDRGALIDRAVFPGLQGRPHNNTTAGIAVALQEASTPAFRTYAHKVVENARVLADALAERGFNLVSDGTDNHLILVDLTDHGIGGKPVAQALDRAGLTMNYNTVPYDPRKPFDPSGIRLGTPAVTTRGLNGEHILQIADWFARGVEAAKKDQEEQLMVIRSEVFELAKAFPVPGAWQRGPNRW